MTGKKTGGFATRLRCLAMAALLAGALAPGAEAGTIGGYVVPGRIPERAIGSLTLSEPKAFHDALMASPLGGPMTKALRASITRDERAWATFQADRGNVERALGFSLDPAEFFGKTLKGADYFLCNLADGSGTTHVTMLSFNSPETPGRIIEHLVSEARNASGTVDGAPSNSVLEVELDERTKMYSLPGLRLHLVSLTGGVLAISDTQEGARAAFGGKASAPLNTSPAYEATIQALTGRESQVWGFGDIGALAKVIGEDLARVQGLALGQLDPAAMPGKGGMIVDMQPTYMKISAFQPTAELPPREQAYTTVSGDDATTISSARFLPQDVTFAFASNLFDARESLHEGIRAAAAAQGQTGGDPVAEAMEKGSEALGVSIENDLVTPLGGDIAFAVSGLRVSAPGSMPPMSGQMVLAVKLTAPDRLRTAMGKLEEKLNSLAPPPPPPPPPKAGAKGTPAPPPPPIKLVAEMTHQGNTVKYLDLGSLPIQLGGDFSPAYSITQGGFLVFSLSKSDVTAAIDRGAGTGRSFTDNEAVSKASRVISPQRNTLGVVNLANVASFAMDAMASQPGANVPPEVRDLLSTGYDLLQASGTAVMSASYSPEGATKETVLVLK